MSPEELQELCALYVLGTLPAQEMAHIEARLQAGDPEVVRDVQAFRRVAGLLPQALPPVAPSPAVRARLMARLQATLPESTDRRAARARRGFGAWFSRPVVWLPAAVMLLLACTLGWLAYDLRQQVRTLQAEVQQLQRAASERERLLALLTGAQVRIVTLAGTAHAPDAGGRLLWDTQRGEWFVVSHDLPALPAAKTYQLWFLTAEGALPSRTFHPDAQQRAILQVQLPPAAAISPGQQCLSSRRAAWHNQPAISS
jgi:hypothetical protein